MVVFAITASFLYLKMLVERSFLSTVILPNAYTASAWQKWKLSCLVRCAAVLHPEFTIQGLLLIVPINTTAILPVEPLGGLSYKTLQGLDKKGAKGETDKKWNILHFSPLKRQCLVWIFLLYIYLKFRWKLSFRDTLDCLIFSLYCTLWHLKQIPWYVQNILVQFPRITTAYLWNN